VDAELMIPLFNQFEIYEQVMAARDVVEDTSMVESIMHSVAGICC